MAATYYQVGIQGWQTYASAFTLAGNPTGSYNIQYYSVDNVGNMETAGSIVVFLDDSKPNTTISYTEAYTQDFVVPGTAFTLTPSDGVSESGVDATYFQVNTQGWHVYDAPFTLAGNATSSYTIYYYSVDNVGNVETAGSVDVFLDVSDPATTIDFTEEYTPNFVIDTTAFTLLSAAAHRNPASTLPTSK